MMIDVPLNFRYLINFLKISESSLKLRLMGTAGNIYQSSNMYGTIRL